MTQRDRVAAEIGRISSLLPGGAVDTGEFDLHGEGLYASAFDVGTAMFASAGAANLAFGVPVLDRSRVVALSAGGATVDGERPPTWAPLSGYYRAGDGGYVQLHANFPHHAAGIVEAFECSHERSSVEDAIGQRTAAEVEELLVGRGMIAARLRSIEEWAEHPHAVATADLPLVSVERIGDAAPREADRRLRVLDCSRVLAGPVAGLTFAAHGADVLRVGSAYLPSVEIGVLTTGSGKRNAFVELDQADGRATFADLLHGADVWVDAYRPGALAGKGFPVEQVPAGTVVVQICAFDCVGPWAGRRGFDSIIQSTTGVVRAGTEAAGADRPTPLPVQALDYCTGLLGAFVARRLVDHQAAEGGTWLARLSLLRTRNWLVGLGGPTPFEPAGVVVDDDAVMTTETPFGLVETARPVSGAWPHGPHPLGSSAPLWLDR